MKKYPKCERCPDEDTDKCNTCIQDPEPSYVGPEDAINYLQEDNDYYKRRLGEAAKLLREYRINQIAIDAIKEKYFLS